VKSRACEKQTELEKKQLVGRFLNYVEIKTKITSTFAFLYTIAYMFYSDQPINWKLTGIFFAAMFLFDLTTTAINNYIDTKTNTQTLQFKRGTALALILVMLAVSVLLGLYLVALTDIIVLLLGDSVFYAESCIPTARFRSPGSLWVNYCRVSFMDSLFLYPCM
jgi:1,4-dihydroxy-2-naphthoate octaprenyltransferase